jgi:uncharacterized Tic20 family protein
MLLHLSQLLMFVLPVLGIAAPIVLWAINRDKDAQVDLHGKMILNWLLSAFIYSVVGVVLAFVLVGFVVILAVVIASIVFPIVGGVKANDGIFWKYPLCITFIQ